MSAKRKAASAATAGVQGPDVKRRKLADLENETPETTATAGLAFIAQIKQARDKRNHLISTHFLTLPDKATIPEYYKVIQLPIALDTIEGKLHRREYPTLTTLESDFKRLVSNAKAFNERNSDIFSDAEKIRKMVSNHMTKMNPAYKDPNYQSFATPVPIENTGNGVLKTKEQATESIADRETDPENKIETRRKLVTLHGPSAEKEQARRRASSTPAIQGAADAGESFTGNTFQQAQEKIITELMELKNDDDQLVAGEFLNLPSRKLKDYYSFIKHPQSLKGIQKQVRGVQGREKPTGVSLFKSWQSFEDEVSKIWHNTRQYNLDTSGISKLAGELEAYFNVRIKEARGAVSEPPQQKVKLLVKPEPPPKITLRIGQKVPAASGNGVSVDNEALKRQQELVKAGANGHTAATDGESSTAPMTKNLTSHRPALNQLPQVGQNGSATSPPLSADGVKSEVPASQSPAIPAVVARHGSNGSSGTQQSPHPAPMSMPPPAGVTPRLPSGSPHPQAIHSFHNNHLTNPLDSRWRQPGKDASDALISNLHVATHPALKIDKHFQLDIPPSSSMSQQSVTITLPATHYCLQFTPTISPSVTHRQSKIFVVLNNNQRYSPSNLKRENMDPTRPLYDIRVIPGVSRIDVEMIAGPPRGAPKVGSGQDIELERITVFINLV